MKMPLRCKATTAKMLGAAPWYGVTNQPLYAAADQQRIILILDDDGAWWFWPIQPGVAQ